MTEQERMENDDTPMIELHKVDTTMAYAARIVHDVKIIVAICIAAIIAIVVSTVLIFTSKYNERTGEWLRTYNQLNGQAEVQNGNTETVQQLSPP